MELTLEEALKKAVEAHKAGDIQEADRLYTAILKAQPKHPDANHNMGVLAVGVDKIEAALLFFKTALEANSSISQFWLSYINALMKLDRIADAQAAFYQAKDKGVNGEGFDQLKKRLFDTNVNQVQLQDPTSEQLQPIINLYTQGNLLQALSDVKEMLKKFPNSAALYNIAGASSAGLMQYDAAIDSYKQATQINPHYAEVYNNMGTALKSKGDLEGAIDSYKQATKINPSYADAYNNMGIALNDKGDLDAAIESYKQTIQINPSYADAYNNMGFALHDKGDLKAALDSYKQAIQINPDYAGAYNNMGTTLKDMGDLEAAIDSYKQAIQINPDYFDVYNNMGNLFQENRQYTQAKECFDEISQQLSKQGLKVYETITMESEVPNSSNSSTLDNIQLDKAEGATIAVQNSPLDDVSSSGARFLNPSPIEYEELYRPGMGTENVGGFLRAMVQMVRPSRILEIGAGYTTPFLLEAVVNNMRVFNDGNLELSYFATPYNYEPKLVVIDDMSLGDLAKKTGMEEIITSKYIEFVHGKFEDKAGMLFEKYGNFDFVWYDCGGLAEYKVFMDKYWDICSGYIFFHFTYSDGKPNAIHDIILDKMTGNPLFFDIVEPHKKRQGSVTMLKKH